MVFNLEFILPLYSLLFISFVPKTGLIILSIIILSENLSTGLDTANKVPSPPKASAISLLLFTIFSPLALNSCFNFGMNLSKPFPKVFCAAPTIKIGNNIFVNPWKTVSPKAFLRAVFFPSSSFALL